MKKMKRSTFITTLLIVVLLIAAVATATYAWFTQTTTAQIDSTQLFAAQASGASLGIGWSATDAQSTNPAFDNTLISFNDNSAMIQPTCPNAALVAGTTLVGAFPEMFFTAPVTGAGMFMNNGTPLAPVTLSGTNSASATSGVITLANNAAIGGDDIDSISITMNFGTTVLVCRYDADTTDTVCEVDCVCIVDNSLIRVALFVRGAYVGTLSQTAAPTVYGPIVQTNSQVPGVDDMLTFTSSGASIANILGATPIAPGATVEVVLIAWYDGLLLNNITAGNSAVFGFTFQAA